MWLSLRLVFLVVVSAGGCSKTANPAVCCTDPADCASIGAAEDNRPCPTALACVDHECVVPDCSTQGCPTREPVCNLATNACEGCDDNADCANFQDEQRCLVETGTCVQCVTSNDCGPTVPVCTANQCRGCEFDTECESGACGDDGMCLSDSIIAYVDPLGDDAGECTKTTPCRTLSRAVSRTTMARNHIVFAPATYAVTGTVQIYPGITPAQTLVLHGRGASFAGSSQDPLIIASLPITIRDLTIRQLGFQALSIGNANAFSVLERVTVEAETVGVHLYGQTRLLDVTIRSVSDGVGGEGIAMTSANLVEMDGVTVSGFDRCIVNTLLQGMFTTLTARNVLAYNCAVRAAELPQTSGVVEFSTFVTQGAGGSSGGRGIDCGASGVTIRTSIVWAPGAATLPVQGCTLVSSIVGPTAVVGTSNADPRFANLATNDFHLNAGSPARDVIDTGPPTDVLRNPRPQGARFDFGAYEQ